MVIQINAFALFCIQLGIFTLVLVIGCTLMMEATKVHNKCVARCWKKLPKCNEYFIASLKAPIKPVKFTSPFYNATTGQPEIFMKRYCHEKPTRNCFENKRTHFHYDPIFDANTVECALSNPNDRMSLNHSMLHIEIPNALASTATWPLFQTDQPSLENTGCR
ncbi:hypothetical protein CSKR_109241 [Clonorchis sinensis]|nr:hypothetical protein CSKR_109241 [Clonorchis sinensis]